MKLNQQNLVSCHISHIMWYTDVPTSNVYSLTAQKSYVLVFSVPSDFLTLNLFRTFRTFIVILIKSSRNINVPWTVTFFYKLLKG